MNIADKTNKFWDWIDQRYIVRRILLISTFLLTTHSYFWAIRFAEETSKSGAELGLIIAAVTAPISLLMSSIAKIYSDGRGT